MNPNEPTLPDADAGDGLPEALRWQLRGLRRDATPQADLWPGIAARLHALPKTLRECRSDTSDSTLRRWRPQPTS